MTERTDHEAADGPAVDAETKPAKTPPAKRKSPLRWVRRGVAILAGLSLGLVATECVFRQRDEGAFPHLNVYVADAELGVALEPGRTQGLKIGSNPTTQVRINAQGFRGEDWPAPGTDDILVVGDSQVFGLGVEANETFSAALAKETGRTALNAGVPTYGPLEFNRLLAKLLPERKPKTVVYVINLANDLFEASRPNQERHAVWDGWAVRKETAPLETASFPGRSWLYRDSHAFFALRQVIYQAAHPRIEDVAMPSEGTWRDFAAGAKNASRERARQRREFVRLSALQRGEVSYAVQHVVQAELEVDTRIYQDLDSDAFDIRVARANPGDITSVGPGEAGSPLAGTVKQIRLAITERNRLEARLKELMAKSDGPKKERIAAALTARDRAHARLDELRTSAPRALVQSSSPLAIPIEEAKRLCDEHGAELVVVALPIDVQVSAEEWKKYPGQEPVDTTGTEVVLTDIVGHANSLGLRGLDAMNVLRASQPGAFLDGDLHMTPKAHAALGKVLAEQLASPLPKEGVTRWLPPGRSRVPRPMDWLQRKEAAVAGSDAAGCETKIFDEWLRVKCTEKKAKPLGIRVISGGGADAIVTHWGKTMTLVVARTRGVDLVADFFWEGETRRLNAPWPASEAIGDDMTMKKTKEPAAAPAATGDRTTSEALCACFQKVHEVKSCDDAFMVEHAPCVATWKDDCESMVACAEGDLVFQPTCDAGFANAGASHHCQPVCGAAGECKVGTCTTWNDEAKVCVP